MFSSISGWRSLPRSSRRQLTGLIASAVAVALAGCQRAADDIDFEAAEMEVLPELALERAASPSLQLVSAAPRLIRNGSARVEVEELDIALSATEQFATDAGGYIAGSELTEGREGARTASLLLRLPSTSFDTVVNRLAELGRVLSVSVSTSDVSREYMDTETRLVVKEETVARLRALAARGGDLEDVLAAERELGRAITELETLKGQLRYFDQRIAESDLRLTLIEPGAVVTSGAFRPVVEAFRDATQVFAQSIAYLVYIVVFLAPWVIVALLAWPTLMRWNRMRRERAVSES